MAKAIVIDANLSYDQAGENRLPRLIGPFPGVEAAERYIDSLGSLWGDYGFAPIFTPAMDGSEGGADRG